MADGVLEKHSNMDELLAVLARTTDGVFALDQTERVVFWNAAAERITGYQADEVLGRPCYEIFGSEQRAGCHKCQPDCPVMRAARNQELVPTYNVLGRTKADTPILLNISVIVPQQCHGSVCTIHLFRDATRQLHYETYVEQILGAAAQLFGSQHTLVQHALEATPFFVPLSAREKTSPWPPGTGQGGTRNCRDPGYQLCHGAQPSPGYPAQI
jgi:PAS domain-containing protein